MVTTDAIKALLNQFILDAPDLKFLEVEMGKYEI